MDRKIVATGVLLTGLLVAMPVLAQNEVWTTDRPDGHAPAGVMADFTLPAGGDLRGLPVFCGEVQGHAHRHPRCVCR